MIQETDIRKFWLWWEKNEGLIRKVVEKGSETKMLELKEHIDRKVLGFGHFTWEILERPGQGYVFIISPNRDPERLQQTKNIVDAAPKLPHWTFSHAKPKNQHIEPFKIYDAKLDPVMVDPGHWEIEYEEGRAKVWAPGLANLDEDTRAEAMDLVVTAHFGEEFRILHINQLEWVPSH